MKKKLIGFIITSFLFITLGVVLYLANALEHERERTEYYRSTLDDIKRLDSIEYHYNDYVRTNKKTNLYDYKSGEFIPVASVSAGVYFGLRDAEITLETEFFFIEHLELFIRYQDVDVVEEVLTDDRWRNYVLFPELITTVEDVNLYQSDEIKFTLSEPLIRRIVRKTSDGYYIEFNNDLYLVKHDDIYEIVDIETTDEYADDIPVLVYHFIYLEGDNTCNEMICHSEHQIREQFSYLRNNDFFTINTTEMQWFLKEEIKLPKNTALITIDDGPRAEHFIPILEQYSINSTLFLISSWFPKENFYSPYMEIASHTHDLHNTRRCPGGQGSALRCYDMEILLADLMMSRSTLNYTTSFAYPFYEYNQHALNAVEEAGFITAFVGGGRRARVGDDLLRIPRISINRNTRIDQFTRIVN